MKMFLSLEGLLGFALGMAGFTLTYIFTQRSMARDWLVLIAYNALL